MLSLMGIVHDSPYGVHYARIWNFFFFCFFTITTRMKRVCKNVLITEIITGYMDCD